MAGGLLASPPMTRTFAALAVVVALVAGTAADDQVLFMEMAPEVLLTDVGANAFSIVGSFVEGGGLYWMPTSGTESIGGRSAVAVSRDGKAAQRQPGHSTNS